jgi:hypothetical protein
MFAKRDRSNSPVSKTGAAVMIESLATRGGHLIKATFDSPTKAKESHPINPGELLRHIVRSNNSSNYPFWFIGISDSYQSSVLHLAACRVCLLGIVHSLFCSLPDTLHHKVPRHDSFLVSDYTL